MGVFLLATRGVIMDVVISHCHLDIWMASIDTFTIISDAFVAQTRMFGADIKLPKICLLNTHMHLLCYWFNP